MSITYEALKEKRDAFNAYAKSVLPIELLENDRLSHSELAGHIVNDKDREKFCELAAAMLDANIAYYRPYATIRATPSSNNTATVAWTLIVMGVVEYVSGTAAALVVGGIWYWLASEAITRRVKELTIQVEAHNAEVAGWAKTLKGWEDERNELDML